MVAHGPARDQPRVVCGQQPQKDPLEHLPHSRCATACVRMMLVQPHFLCRGGAGPPHGQGSRTAGRQAIFLPCNPPPGAAGRGPITPVGVDGAWLAPAFRCGCSFFSPGLDLGLDLKPLGLALRPHQRLVVVRRDPTSLDPSLHLHSHPPFWSCSDTVRTAPLTPRVAARCLALASTQHTFLSKSHAMAHEARQPLSLHAILLASRPYPGA